MSDRDIVDLLAGIVPGSKLDAIRRARPQTRDNIQASYEALFAPQDEGAVPLIERLALAVFVAGLHRAEAEHAFYQKNLVDAGADVGLVKAISHAAETNMAEGPKGAYPPGPLSQEDTPPPIWALAADVASLLGLRLAAAFRHAHMLVYHPRDASRQDLDVLLAAGWTTSAIVTFSQIVAFLSFQLRVVAGLRVLTKSTASRTAA